MPDAKYARLRNRLRAFGQRNPLTLATATLAIGFVLGVVFG